MVKSKIKRMIILFLIVSVWLIMLVLSRAIFVEALTFRLLMIFASSLTSILLSHTFITLLKGCERWEKALFVVFFTFISLASPVLLLRSVAIAPLGTELNEEMLLFNHIIDYDYLNEKLIFFQNPTNHHAYYPSSFIFAKIMHDLTGDVYFVNLSLLPSLIFLLFLAFVWSSVHKLKNCDGLLPAAMLLYSICMLSISYIYAGGLLYQWNVRSIAWLVTISLLTSFMRSKNRKPSDVIMLSIILPALLMSDSIFLPIGLILFSFYSCYLTRKKMLGFAKLLLIEFLAYQAHIGFISYVMYGDYLWLLKDQIIRLTESLLNPSSMIDMAIVKRSTPLPFLDRILIVLSFSMMYLILPAILFIYSILLSRKLRKLVIPLLAILIITDASQVAARLVPNIFINNVGSIFAYSYFPLMNLSLALYIISNKGTPEIDTTAFTPYIRKQLFKKQYIWFILFSVMIFSSSVYSTFFIYPKSINDPIEFIDDGRIAHYNTRFLANFLNNHWGENARVYYHISTHIQQNFLRDEIRLSWYLGQGREIEVITLPMLPTYFEDRAEFYRKLDPTSCEVNIVYAQGKWLIITKQSP